MHFHTWALPYAQEKESIVVHCFGPSTGAKGTSRGAKRGSSATAPKVPDQVVENKLFVTWLLEQVHDFGELHKIYRNWQFGLQSRQFLQYSMGAKIKATIILAVFPEQLLRPLGVMAHSHDLQQNPQPRLGSPQEIDVAIFLHHVTWQ